MKKPNIWYKKRWDTFFVKISFFTCCCVFEGRSFSYTEKNIFAEQLHNLDKNVALYELLLLSSAAQLTTSLQHDSYHPPFI